MTAAGDPLLRAVQAAFTPSPPARLGVAVSGGGDSMALLHLMAGWRGGPEVSAVTVDHGLRPEAAAEAAMVAAASAWLGVPHRVLRWQWEGRGNLADAARRGRYGLIAEWARGEGIGAVALGHTLDDQAETVLMRLARGSGVDGLSGMDVRREAEGIAWVRPLLSVRRADLRDWLTARGIGWAEDPTNADEGYGRVRARTALAALTPLGVTVEGLAATAERMRMARGVLDRAAADLARRAVTMDAGDVVIDRALWADAEEETRLRLVAAALRWVASADYRPRLAALREALDRAGAGRRVTLHGCLILPRQGTFRIAREAAAVAGLESPPETVWDRRWRLNGPGGADYAVRMLGETGLAQCPDWRGTGRPRASLLASPAVWNGAQLIAAPLAGLANGWTATLRAGADDFLAALMTH